MRLNLGKLDLFVKLLKLEAFRANLVKDRGRATAYGVSSRAWPTDYARLEEAGWNLDLVFLFYNEKFMVTIPEFTALLRERKELACLLFLGKVHGTGIRDYTRVVQSALRDNGIQLRVDGLWGPVTAGAVLALDAEGYARVLSALRTRKQELIDRRIKAVGAYPRGIANRVKEEFTFAFEDDREKLHNL